MKPRDALPLIDLDSLERVAGAYGRPHFPGGSFAAYGGVDPLTAAAYGFGSAIAAATFGTPFVPAYSVGSPLVVSYGAPSVVVLGRKGARGRVGKRTAKTA